MKSHSALNKFSGHSRAVLDKPDCSVLCHREKGTFGREWGRVLKDCVAF